jgi:hypothetical protein
VYQFSSKSDGNGPFYSIHLNFKHGGGGYFESGWSLPVLHFVFGRKSRNYLSNFIGIGRKLTELLQFEFFHNGGCRHLAFDDR